MARIITAIYLAKLLARDRKINPKYKVTELLHSFPQVLGASAYFHLMYDEK